MRLFVAAVALIAVTASTATAGKHKKTAVVVVLDRSGSMKGMKLERAKAATMAAVEALAKTDQVAVVTFDSAPTVTVPLQAASHKDQIAPLVDKIDAGGGTNLTMGLAAAYAEIKPAKAKRKHVIVLSDGESPYDGLSDLVDAMRADGITVSAVGVSGADRNLLTLIAEHGDGQLFMVEELDRLPKIFADDVERATKK